MGVSRVRVGDSRVRGRGRGQGVSAINGRISTAFAAVAPSPHKHWGNKHALPPFLLLREKKTTLPPFCFEEQKTQTIAAISAVGEQRFIKHRRHFAVGEQRFIKHRRHFAVGVADRTCKTLQEQSTLA